MKQFVIVPRGRLGNQMAQYLVAHKLRQLVAGLEVVGYHMPEWGLVAPGAQWDCIRMPEITGHLFDVRQVARWLNRKPQGAVRFSGIGLHLSHFPSAEDCRSLFHSEAAAAEPVGADEILINIRAEDVFGRGTHPDYGLLPMSFYRHVVETTGLRPVFHGQIEDGPYVEGLRRQFPAARFLASRGAVADFQTIRQAAQIVLSISSFSWMAAWLSEARRIFMPVFGLYNPGQRPDIDLLPADDARYQFYGFPLRRWNGWEAERTALMGAQYPFRRMEPREVERARHQACRRTAARRFIKRCRFAADCLSRGRLARLSAGGPAEDGPAGQRSSP